MSARHHYKFYEVTATFGSPAFDQTVTGPGTLVAVVFGGWVDASPASNNAGLVLYDTNTGGYVAGAELGALNAAPDQGPLYLPFDLDFVDGLVAQTWTPSGVTAMYTVIWDA